MNAAQLHTTHQLRKPAAPAAAPDAAAIAELASIRRELLAQHRAWAFPWPPESVSTTQMLMHYIRTVVPARVNHEIATSGPRQLAAWGAIAETLRLHPMDTEGITRRVSDLQQYARICPECKGPRAWDDADHEMRGLCESCAFPDYGPEDPREEEY